MKRENGGDSKKHASKLRWLSESTERPFCETFLLHPDRLLAKQRLNIKHNEAHRNASRATERHHH